MIDARVMQCARKGEDDGVEIRSRDGPPRSCWRGKMSAVGIVWKSVAVEVRDEREGR